MTFHRFNQEVILGLSVPLGRFHDLYSEFLRRYPDTLSLEASGAEIMQGDFDELHLKPFVAQVCKWGGYPGIGGRILKHNTLRSIGQALREATSHLASSPPDCSLALIAINRLHSLGTPSFASKHLRFLRPDICPVYDDILRNALPYSYDPQGYGQFSSDCLGIARILRNEGVENPGPRLRGEWYAADVEASIFAHVNRWVT